MPTITQQIQTLVGASPDGVWGKISDYLLKATVGTLSASSFADPKDVQAFRECKREGKSDEACFKVGDNGIGFTGIDVSKDTENWVALPYEIWMDKWGSKFVAAGKELEISYNGKTIKAKLGDTMPHLANIKNGAGMDWNPGVVKAFGLKPPIMAHGVSWKWLSK